MTEGPERLLAAIANRVSQVKGASIPEQNQENHDASEERGWDIHDVYSEAGSASRFAKKNRQEWARLLRDLEAGCFQAVILWESSRGDRTLLSWIQFLEMCRERGVLIHVTSESKTYDVRISSDYNQLAQAGIANREESERTHKRVSRTVRRRAMEGKVHGKIPFGFRREYEFVKDPETGRQVRVIHQLPDEVTAPLVREMATRALASEPMYAIAMDLNKRGIKTATGRAWEGARVQQIILVPAIAGYRVFQGEIVGEGDWPAVLSESGDHAEAQAIYASLQAKLKDPKRRTYVDGKVKHVLTGIAVCGHDECNLPLKRAKNHGCPSYVCWYKKPEWNEDGTPVKRYHVSIKQEFLDDIAQRVLVKRLSRPDARAAFVTNSEPANLKSARNDLATLKGRLDGFYSQAARGKLSEGGLARIEAELLPDIERAKRRVEQQEKAMARSPLVDQLIGAEGDSAGVAERYWALSVPQRREVFRAVVVPVVMPQPDRRYKMDVRRIKFRDPITGEFWATAEFTPGD